jgi:hypothetical protein
MAGAAAGEHYLWRFLEETNGNVTQSSSNGTQEESQFDAKVYWGVIAFLLVMASAACAFCWCFADKDMLTQWFVGGRRVDSDLEYQLTLRQRHERRMTARRSTPAKRTARLKRSFVSNRVQMVRQTGRQADRHCGCVFNGADTLLEPFSHKSTYCTVLYCNVLYGIDGARG